MSRWRKPTHRDANHKALVAVFERMGCSFADLASVGQGVPDGVVGCSGRNVLVEFKNPDNWYGRRGLSGGQADWSAAWRGEKPVVVRTEDDAIALVQGLRALPPIRPA